MPPVQTPKTYRAGLPLSYPKVSVFTRIFSGGDPHSTAFIDANSGDSLTRGQVYDLSLRLAYGFRNLSRYGRGSDMNEGDAVMLFSPNDLLFPVVYLAGFAAGTPVAAASAASVPAELVHGLQITKCNFFVVHPSLLSVFEAAMELMGKTSSEYRPRTVLLQPEQKDRANGSFAYSSVFGIMDPTKMLQPVRFDGEKANETAVYWFSSGTTGLSKAIECSHKAIVAQGEATSWWLRLEEGDVTIGPFPHYHVAGGMYGIFHPLIARHTAVFCSQFSFERLLEGVTKYKASMLHTVPPLITALTRHPSVETTDWSHLKILSVGAAPVRPHELRKAYERLCPMAPPGLLAFQGHGMSETCALTKVNIHAWNTKWAACGVPTPGTELKLMTADGKDADIDQPAELWERGDVVMRSYYGNPKATSETITPDGWLRTGDVCVMDNDGQYYVVDRIKELIKYKGYQVAPAELEAILTKHPDVIDSGVIGIMSENEGLELPKAFVVPRDSSLLSSKILPQTICEWIRPRVSHYKALRGGVTLVPSIPRSASGKILRGQLRKLHQLLTEEESKIAATRL